MTYFRIWTVNNNKFFKKKKYLYKDTLVQKLFGYIFFATTYSAKTYGFNREFFFFIRIRY